VFRDTGFEDFAAWQEESNGRRRPMNGYHNPVFFLLNEICFEMVFSHQKQRGFMSDVYFWWWRTFLKEYKAFRADGRLIWLLIRDEDALNNTIAD